MIHSPKAWVVLRASPDWLNLDMEQTRPFMKANGGPETLIIDFAALWDAHFAQDYRTVRHRLKELSFESYRAVQDAEFLAGSSIQDYGIAPPRVAFVDDDDWLSPALVRALPAPSPQEDGVRWGSLRLGRIFGESGYSQGIVQRRPLDGVIYTNNYAVNRDAISKRGLDKLFEHHQAQHAFDDVGFNSHAVSSYLSCAVKHPCCTLSARFLMKRPEFRAEPRREIDSFMKSLFHFKPVEEVWLDPILEKFRSIMEEATRPKQRRLNWMTSAMRRLRQV